MSAAEHRIGRIVFQMEAPDPAAVAAFGDTIRARFEAVIEPALQAALDRIDRPGGVIRLGSIEVDLSDLDASPSAEDLGRRIVAGLAAALPAAARAASEDAGADRDDAAELIGFLETGELPWAEPGKALAALTDALCALDAPGMRRLGQRLRTVLIRRRAAERLVRQLPAPLVRRLLRALLPDALAAPLAAFGPDMPVATSAPPAGEALAPRLIEAFHGLAKGTTMPDLGEAVSLFAPLDGRIPLAMKMPEGPSPRTAKTAEAADEAVLADWQPPLHEEPEEEPPKTAIAVSQPVYAAGAVLLHPFLGRFFERLGLLEAPGRFRDRAALSRAVLLAHHLATGADDAPEPETVLFKLMCGMEASDPVPRRIILTDTERQEAASLLEGVISHWSKLGNTSAAGLREGFLTRPGRLHRRGAQWQLTVERRGIDILLDDLPWTLSRVKTPFMRTILTVDWR